MGKQNDDGTGDGAGDKGQKPEPKLSNSDVKAHPLFRKLTTDNADLQKRLDALEAVDTERKTKQLEAEKDYEKALGLNIEKAVKDARKKWDAEKEVTDARSEAKLELVKAGFKNERFLKGALAEFDPSSQSAADFAKEFSEDKANAPFLDTAKKTANPDPQPAPNSKIQTLSPEEIQSMRQSGDKEKIQKANDYVTAQWEKSGTTGLPT